MAAELIFYGNDELLEGPIFDIENETLYFVSILDQLVYKYNPNTKCISSVKLDSPVGCLFLMSKNQVVAATKKGFFLVDFDYNRIEKLFDPILPENVRFNDGIKDAKGRWIVGTMGYPEVIEGIGKVFSVESGKIKTLIENTTISNGLAFADANDLMYFIDTPTQKVMCYNYDIKTGEVSNPISCIDFKSDGFPDGMCKDLNGNLWIAEWGGACISLWNPNDGQKISKLELPTENVTSCTFDHCGGLYVTTAKSENPDNKLGGGLFYFDKNHF